MPWYCALILHPGIVQCTGVPTLVLAPISQAVSLAPDDMTSHPIHCVACAINPIHCVLFVVYHTQIHCVRCWYYVVCCNTPLSQDIILKFNVVFCNPQYISGFYLKYSLTSLQYGKTAFTCIFNGFVQFSPFHDVLLPRDLHYEELH